MTPESSTLPRLFAAIGWRNGGAEPLLELRELLREILAAAPLRWSAPEDLHATLRFYGDATAAQAGAIATGLALQAAGYTGQPFEFARLETWPAAKPTLLVATLLAPPRLREQQQAIERAAQAAGWPAETRPWKPHVTLARAQDWDGALPRLKLAPFELPARHWVLWHRKTVSGAGYAQYWP
jgi:RNA 2',3'-cyclic 3'-phosphodiesterase